MKPFVKTLLTGRVKELGEVGATNPMDRPWTTGMFKEPVSGNIWLSRTGLSGDETGDTKNHGGPEKAVFAYPSEHYVYWQSRPGLEAMSVGAHGENLSLENVTEEDVCIGDVYQFCDAVIQVSQPRQPCWKPARRFRVKDLALQIQETGRTGWYFRVLQEGLVRSGGSLVLLERTSPRWTIAVCNRVMHRETSNRELAAELAALPYLAVNWKSTLERRLAGGVSSIDSRVFGPNQE